jgi:CubicO group peptidase (beta-lactamase class C family)
VQSNPYPNRLGSGRAVLLAAVFALISVPARSVEIAGTDRSDTADAILALTQEAMEQQHLRAVIVRVVVGGHEVVTAAFGESMTGVAATPDMHFRNGAVAISYVATLLLQLADRGTVGLDDPISRWMPDLPEADDVTLRMLANMTSGYPDYVQNPELLAMLDDDPFRQFTADELISLGLSQPRTFAPGTNWDYSHTNIVILGRILEEITGLPLAQQMRENIFTPLGMTNTEDPGTPAIREPVLHAFTSERRSVLGIDPSVRFYEESTYWNPSWTLAPGAVQTTDIYDMTTGAIAVGRGTLLSQEAHAAQVEPRLLGFGSVLEGCPACHPLDRYYSYGLGVVIADSWIFQNPLFYGYAAVAGYLPSKDIAIAIAVTFDEDAFDAEGNYLSGRAGYQLMAAIGAYLAPDEPPPFRQ